MAKDYFFEYEGEQIPNNWINRLLFSNDTLLGRLRKVLQRVSQPEYVNNYLNAQTGAALTDAQREANAFTAEREDIAWNRQLQASNTEYQRTVEDLKAAGLNPMLALGRTVSTPSAGTSGSVSPQPTGDVVSLVTSLLQMKKQMALMDSEAALNKANAAKADADAAKAQSETVGIDILNNYRDASERLRLQGLGLSNDLTSGQIKEVYKQLDIMAESQRLLSAQADTEVERKAAVAASRMLTEAQAYQIVALLPYEKALKSAQTEQARQAALLSAANAAYQNGLIDSGWIEAQLRSLNANAEGAELRNAEQAVKTAFRTGKMPEGYEDTFGKADSWTIKNILMPFNNVLENLNPLAGIIKIGASL